MSPSLQNLRIALRWRKLAVVTMPTAAPPTCPLTRSQVMNLYFMEHRAKLLDIAAFLDRLDRGVPTPPTQADTLDAVRLTALRDVLALVNDGQPNRVRRVLELLSDPTLEPIPKAGGKGAAGVWPQRAGDKATEAR